MKNKRIRYKKKKKKKKSHDFSKVKPIIIRSNIYKGYVFFKIFCNKER